MTLHEVSKQVFDLALGHFINGEKFTLQRLEHQFHCFLREEAGGHYIFEICLPDGRWLGEVERHGKEFGYWIPETREQEEVLYHRLGIG